jgi:hypothetical protein
MRYNKGRMSVIFGHKNESPNTNYNVSKHLLNKEERNICAKEHQMSSSDINANVNNK